MAGDVGVLFADIVGFTPLAAARPPEEIVAAARQRPAPVDAVRRSA